MSMARTAPFMAVGALFLLGGCVTSAEQQAALQARDDGVCQSYGVSRGSDGYVACRMQAAQIRANQQAAQFEASRQMFIAGTQLMAASQPGPTVVAAPPVMVNVQTAPVCVRGPYNTVSCR